MGVREVWVVNPAARSVMIFAGAAMVEHTDGELTVPGTPATLAVPEIFQGARRVLRLGWLCRRAAAGC